MAACFEKGSDLTVLVNGRVLGGVLRLRRRVKRGAQEIREFLTDKPVALIPTEVYYIEMELRRAPGYPFDDAVETVTVTGGGRTEVYSLCTVERARSDAEAHGEVAYTVVIAARERSVSDE